MGFKGNSHPAASKNFSESPKNGELTENCAAEAPERESLEATEK